MKLTQLSPRSHSRHLVGKRTTQKDTNIDTTSDSQVNSNFTHRWSPASLTFNNYFNQFLYLYITRISINKNTPQLKSPKNQNRSTTLKFLKLVLLSQCYFHNNTSKKREENMFLSIILVHFHFPRQYHFFLDF